MCLYWLGVAEFTNMGGQPKVIFKPYFSSAKTSRNSPKILLLELGVR